MVGKPTIAELETDALASLAPMPESAAPTWHPDLNPTQQKIFDDSSRFVLGYGEKGSNRIWA